MKADILEISIKLNLLSKYKDRYVAVFPSKYPRLFSPHIERFVENPDNYMGQNIQNTPTKF